MSIQQVNKNMGQGGFTLLELIVVICILGVIAAFSVVSYGPAQTESHNAQALNDVKNTLTACQSCCFQGCETCVLVEDTTDPENEEKMIQCGECPNPDDETTRYVLSSYDIIMTLTSAPLVCSDDEVIGAFHEKGSKTFCLYESTGDLDSYSNQDLTLCSTTTPPTPW